MPVADADAIRRAVDSPIGENLTCPGLARTGDPRRYKGVPCFARAAIIDSSQRKSTHPRPPRRAFYTRMNKTGRSLRRRYIMDYALAAMSQMELYCEAHPGSPSAVRRPRLFVRGELWIALLGPSVEEGIVGIGPTVTAALRAFDAQYLAGLRPPAEATHNYRQRRSPSSAVASSHLER
jgi:hypothetical protein